MPTLEPIAGFPRRGHSPNHGVNDRPSYIFFPFLPEATFPVCSQGSTGREERGTLSSEMHVLSLSYYCYFYFYIENSLTVF